MASFSQHESVTSAGVLEAISPYMFRTAIAVIVGLFFFTNLKSLPGMWHIKLFSLLAKHIYIRKESIRTEINKKGVQVLFQPLITSSYAPPLEIDYNLHKSNSTFFSDLDHSRTELILTLFKDIIAPRAGSAIKKKSIALGGVSCIFKRQIAPYEKYDIWSRLLCWDHKWVYIVSHFVTRGANRPAGKSKPRKITETEEVNGVTQVGDKVAPLTDPSKDIFASAIAKYVFKDDRLTIAPEDALLEAQLIPSPPAGRKFGDGKQGTTVSYPVVETLTEGFWNWDRVQFERLQGMKVAQNFTNLDDLHGTFSGSSGAALAVY